LNQKRLEQNFIEKCSPYNPQFLQFVFSFRVLIFHIEGSSKVLPQGDRGKSLRNFSNNTDNSKNYWPIAFSMALANSISGCAPTML